MEAAALRRLDRLIWSLVTLTAAAVLVAPLFSRFSIDWQSFVAPGMACALLVAGSTVYARWRRDARLAAGLAASAQVIAFAAVGAPLSYLAAAAGAHIALQDHVFDAIDRAFGFDWKALLAIMNEAPLLYAPLRLSYLTLTVQMTTVVLCLAYTGRLLWLRTYTLAFILTTLASIAISTLLPAAGVWPHYGLTAADSPHLLPAASTSWPVFYGLRDGTLRTLVAIGSEGVITFPSLHAALAVVLIAALWPLPVLRWIGLALNLLMLVATPIDGSHYFVDVFAGIALAVMCLYGAYRIAVHFTSKHAPAAVGKIPQFAARK